MDLANKYRNPVMVLADGAIGQMMERVELMEFKPRWTVEEIQEKKPWATFGKPADGERRIITSLDLAPERLEEHNHHLQAKYREVEANEVRYESIMCDDAEVIIVAYGLASRIVQKSVQLAREEGIKVGILRPITLYPYPYEVIKELAENDRIKGFLTMELNEGQMVEDVRLGVNGKKPVFFYGRSGGMLPTPDEIVNAIKKSFNI
jgi:2-oxoglutarate ferredoxin oxidoreductase subunit alpha